MKHSEKMATGTYKLRNNIKVAAETSEKLEQVMRGNSDDTKLLNVIFAEEIRNGDVCTDNIRSKIETDRRLATYSEKQLLDRVRYMIVRTKKPPQSKEEVISNSYTCSYVANTAFEAAVASSDCVSVSSGTSGRARVKFSNGDLLLIRTKLASLINNSYPNTGERLRAICGESEELGLLINTFGEHSIMNKIRNERKKVKRK